MDGDDLVECDAHGTGLRFDDGRRLVFASDIAVDDVCLEAIRDGAERIVVDENAMDNDSDSLLDVSVDDSRHYPVETHVGVIHSRMLRSLEYEFDHVGHRYVFWIPSSFTNVVEGLRIGHRYSLCGALVHVICRWL